ncbi:MAG: peptidylprolyl isomerase [Saprospiraceae bacterium]|nr:peptidylprolyl isomerase [Saprospiraceae bacterium]
MNRIPFVLILFFCGIVNSIGQSNDQVLFDVGGEKTPVSEFLYIYQKNLGEKADFSKKSLEEYLDLYVNFKLKVKKAKELKLDTTPAFKKEMAGYREQLAKSYLVDKEVSEKLLNEAYERMGKDLKVSHIMISVKAGEDETKVKNLVDSLYKELKNNKSFEQMAKDFSNDSYSNNNGGSLGWVTSLLPNGFYEFENKIYSLKKGEFSKPFRTGFGYHIVKLLDERPARGEIEASHILIRNFDKEMPVPSPKFKIDSIYDRLKAGDNFVQLAREFSMDNKTAPKGGYLGIFGINKYDQVFEDEVFALQNNGDYSRPFNTTLGWHIVKRMSKPGVKSFEAAKRSLTNEINQNERYGVGRKALTDKIKAEGKFKEDLSTLDYFSGLLNEEFYTFKWKAPEFTDRFLFELSSRKFMLSDLVKYLKNNQRGRLNFNKATKLIEAAASMYNSYVEDECIKFEESKLEDKYPDFKFLMREYTEGNLLFEVMEKEVWNKAAKDTVGLKSFFENNREKYLWQPRAELYTYTVQSGDKKLTDKIYKFSVSNSTDKLIKKFNKKAQIISFKTDKLEAGDKELEGIDFAQNAMTKVVADDTGNTSKFKKIDKIIPISQKTLDEAKGYVIADYQEYLENNWIKDLKKNYPVRIDTAVFESLIK